VWVLASDGNARGGVRGSAKRTSSSPERAWSGAAREALHFGVEPLRVTQKHTTRRTFILDEARIRNE
jgi:hypothetical protein